MKDQAHEEAARIVKNRNDYLRKTHGEKAAVLDDDDVLTMIGLMLMRPGIKVMMQ